MSCWVVPSIAAEFWGTTVADVMERIRRGTVPSKVEYGFLVVDVAPGGSAVSAQRTAAAAPPPTYVLAELPEMAYDDAPAGDGEPGTEISWREPRRKAAALRRPPAAHRLAA